MGTIDAAIAIMAISATAKAGQSAFEAASASEKRQALDLQAKALELETQQKTLGNYDVMEKVIAAQQAHMTTTGAAFSSPSFNAIQRHTVNTAAKQAKNIEIEGELAQRNLEYEKKNVKNTLFAQLFGNASELGMAAANFSSKLPTKNPS